MTSYASGTGTGSPCRAGGIDIAEWMVRMGWALAAGEKLREAEGEARAARQGMWWYEEESFARKHGAPPARYVPPSLPGEDAVRACMEAGETAFARREYGNLMAVEAVEWLIEETRLRWERRHAMEGDGADTAPEALDDKTRESLDAARELCDLLGGRPKEAMARRGTPPGKQSKPSKAGVGRLADSARETCREAAAGVARAGRIEDLTSIRQIARHTMLLTGRLGERLWQARERGETTRKCARMLARAYAVFERAERQCNALAEE